MPKHTITENRTISQRDLLRASYVYCFWGEQSQIEKFLQCYAVEKAKLEARRKGHSVTEQPLADGSIKLVIQVAGGAA